MESVSLPANGGLKTSAGMKVVDNGKKGDGADGEGVSGVWCFGESSDRCKCHGAGPRGVGVFDGRVEVCEKVEPKGGKTFDFNKTPTIGTR